MGFELFLLFYNNFNIVPFDSFIKDIFKVNKFYKFLKNKDNFI